jgi:sterol desaturase/sphingolipid hydroxylase (fatty acid hydroxylase superfamily)
VFIWGFGAQLQVWDILGVNALGFLLTLAGSNLRHSHIPLGFGSFERFIISPAQHQLHHSIDHGHGNLGAYLALWDRWNKSFIWGSSADNLTFGLSDYEEKASPNRGLPVGDFPH